MENRYYDPAVNLLLVSAARDLRRSWRQDSYASPHWRFYWNNAPGAHVRHDGARWDLHPEQLFLIPANTRFAGVCTQACAQLYVHFLAAPPYDHATPGIYPLAVPAGLREVLTESLELAADSPAGDRRLALLALHLVLTALVRFPEEALPRRVVDPRIAAVMERLAPTAAATPGNAELARTVGVCRNAFVRLFRQSTGESPQAYARRKRIEEACLLLHYSDLDIKAIAQRAGFCNRYHFSKVFKDLRGLSPAAFRNLRPRDQTGLSGQTRGG